MASGTVADSFVASDVLKSDDGESAMNVAGANAYTTTIEAPTSFSLFPKLPVELRLNIWRYASFEQRNVDIWTGRMKLSGRRSSTQKPHYFYSTCPHPVVLHVSREARSEAEKHYSLCFGACAESNGTMVISSCQIYVNPRADRICIMDSRLGFFPTALEDLIEQIEAIKPTYLALNTYAEEEDIQSWVDTLHDYVLFHRHPEQPKSGQRGSVVFESLDGRYSPQSVPKEAQCTYQYTLGRILGRRDIWDQGLWPEEDGMYDCEVSVRELKWKAQVEFTETT